MKDILEQRIKLLEACAESKELQAIEVETCTLDIQYRFSNYVYTDKNSNLYSLTDPDVLPFIPYEYQVEAANEIWSSIMNGTFALEERYDLTNIFIEKSRQMGLSWLIMAVLVYGRCFHNHKYLVLSQKEDDVDKIGDMRSLFEKARFIIKNMPERMLPVGYNSAPQSENNKYMNINRPDGTGSITGESANQNASRSGTYNAILMDEFAFMSNASTINGAAASATPCRIFNSTPNGKGNEHYRMREMAMPKQDKYGTRLDPEIKGLRYHWSEHPLYTQERYKWKTKGMSREKIAQELEIDYDTAIVGRVYPEFPKEITPELKYDHTKPLYIAIDNSHGGTDPNSVIIVQPDGPRWNVIDYVEFNSTPEDAANFLRATPKMMVTDVMQKFMDRYKQYNYKKAIFIADPYDTKSAMGNSTILDDYKNVGINLMMPNERKKTEQIMKTRTNLYRIRYSDNCKEFANAMLNARYPETKEDSQSTQEKKLPVHNWTSHARTAREYFVTYILENPMTVKKKILEDTRPYRDATGRLVYRKTVDLKIK